MHEVVLLLGSNIGNRLAELNEAEKKIELAAGHIIKQSKVYETASWGDKSLAPFLNKVIAIETNYSPLDLLAILLRIEEEMGRHRNIKWESRVIDIDILFYGNEIINLPQLIIPHPYLHLRKFTLIPLVEIYPSKIHPVFLKTCKQLLEGSEDKLEVAEYFPIITP